MGMRGLGCWILGAAAIVVVVGCSTGWATTPPPPPTTFLGPAAMSSDPIGSASIFVSPEGRGVRVLPPAQRRVIHHGFIYGIDLREAPSVTFLLDVGEAMCGRLAAPTAMIRGALAGLPPSTRIALIAASGGRVEQFFPMAGHEGRQAAVAWLNELRCRRGRSLTRGLRRAFDLRPALVVALSAFAVEPSDTIERVRRESPNDLPSYADALTEVERWKDVVPVISVSFHRGNPRGPLLAAISGGAYTAAADLPVIGAPAPGGAVPVAAETPSLDAQGQRVTLIGSPLRPNCRRGARVVGLAGGPRPRPPGLAQAAFERWLPIEAARNSARNRAGRLGAKALSLDSHATIESDWPDDRSAHYVALGWALECDGDDGRYGK
jgi:hypothetical protein